jgi:ferredoxin
MPDESGFEAATQLYINPELCVDCDACREACPVNAIFAVDQLPVKWVDYISINAAYFQRQSVTEACHD